MKNNLQLTKLFKEFDNLQEKFGDKKLSAIYGAGKIKNPKICLVFMNPTGRNISSQKKWIGIRAPWLGTKQVYKLLNELKLLDKSIVEKINSKKFEDWDETFSEELYTHISNNSIYITNLCKATQIDARPLANKIFKEYLSIFKKEIDLIKPQIIITFGNQVSSIILDKQISVSKYRKKFEYLEINKHKYKVYPVFYPVGQGTPNLKLAKADIKQILKNNK